MSNPLRGINANGERVLQSNVTKASVFFENAPLDTMVLGKVALSQVSYPVGGCSGQVFTTSKLYMIVNWHAKQFQLATLTQTSEDASSNLTAFNSASTSTTCSNPEISALASYSWVKSQESWILPNILIIYFVLLFILGYLFWKFILKGFSFVRKRVGECCLTRARKRIKQPSPLIYDARDTAARGNEANVREDRPSSTETVGHLTALDLELLSLQQSGETTEVSKSRGSDTAQGEGPTNTRNSMPTSFVRELANRFGSGTTPTRGQSFSSSAAQRR
jgi:hypothetical protein